MNDLIERGRGILENFFSSDPGPEYKDEFNIVGRFISDAIAALALVDDAEAENAIESLEMIANYGDSLVWNQELVKSILGYAALIERLAREKAEAEKQSILTDATLRDLWWAVEDEGWGQEWIGEGGPSRAATIERIQNGTNSTDGVEDINQGGKSSE